MRTSLILFIKQFICNKSPHKHFSIRSWSCIHEVANLISTFIYVCNSRSYCSTIKLHSFNKFSRCITAQNISASQWQKLAMRFKIRTQLASVRFSGLFMWIRRLIAIKAKKLSNCIVTWVPRVPELIVRGQVDVIMFIQTMNLVFCVHHLRGSIFEKERL